MKIVKIVCCFCLLLIGILAISQPIPTLAARPPLEEGEERVNLDVTYPTVEVTPGASSEFVVQVRYATYRGEGEACVFDLVTIAPKNWTTYITEQYKKETRISAITLDPVFSTPQNLRLVVIPPFWYMPEPGEYTITLEVIGTNQSGEELKGSIELKAVIPATYILALVPTAERYNTSATAGRDNYFSVELQNNGSGAIDDITFSWDKPRGWTIEFSPDSVDSLIADSSQTMEVNIKPPSRTIAGDYSITLRAEAKQTSARELDIRVTVKTPTIWGWVGVGIVVAVIAGIVFVFMRFSRR